MEEPRGSADSKEKQQRRSRLQQELASLKERIADLDVLERELTRAAEAISLATDERSQALRSAEIVRSEIEDRVGFFPPYLQPAMAVPEVLEELWRQLSAGYLDNPLPEPFKTRLAALLSRYCAAPYAIITYSCKLRDLGVTPEGIMALLDVSLPASAVEVDGILRPYRDLAQPVAAIPAPDPELETGLLRACAYCFLHPAQSASCNAALHSLLGPKLYAHLVLLLVHVRSLHTWLEAHPQCSYHADPLVQAHLLPMLREAPRLGALLRNYQQAFAAERERPGGEEVLKATEPRYRELFENASDMVYTLDLDGRITSLNKAAERLTGYSRAEALRMK
ncbi:MAG: PAS domain S-box protein, partial [Acidobacteriota bacterium]